ncbi:uncharacterized protein LOC129580750 [Paramacrobiotus metropolitanus]|uniref:uncharacterized protein LOC129580750 n=1 Tax=Paramacrobiotus metropolitanus TaxID=2943436 RepID=UPI002445A3C9|nr:uncharacterized protein LOC129580750 [Paramacrobiotus metropolitanus]
MTIGLLHRLLGGNFCEPQLLTMPGDQPKEPCHICGKPFTKGAGLSNHVKACAKKAPTQAPGSTSSPPDQQPLQSFLAGKHYAVPKRVPKSVRRLCAQSLTEVLRTCIRENTSASWADLLLFGSRALCLPATKTLRKESLSSIIRKNLSDLSRHQHPPRQHAPPRTQQGELSSERMSALATSMLQDNNIRRAIGLVMGDDSVAPVNAETLKELRNKHPCEPADSLYPPPPDQSNVPPLVAPAEVLQAVMSFLRVLPVAFRIYAHNI